MPVAHQLRLRSVCLGIALALALVVPTSASASDKSLKTTLATWSHQIQGISLSATRHHPQRMTTKARQFRLTALRAQRALSAQRPTTARGHQAKSLALAAFRSYAAVGREWALSGEARLHRNMPAATKHARLASDFAKKGNSLLVRAGKLLR
jgi:hypothetical protein